MAHFNILLVSCLLVSASLAADPIWTMQQSGVKASLRGLCVVNAQVAWASGSEGTVLRTDSAGEQWINVSIAQASELDFRDIHAFDAKRAIVLSAGQPARVYQTLDGGKNWLQQFEHPRTESFFDALSFWDKTHGIAMSDPIDGRVLLIESLDGGATWTELPESRRPPSLAGEAGFAASGTNMRVVGDRVLIALGGGTEGTTQPTSRIVYSTDRAKTWAVAQVPIPRNASSGIFSIAFSDGQHGMAVGGDYKNPTEAARNIALTADGGRTWKRPAGKPPHGFRSCVAAQKVEGKVLWVAVGTSGEDYSVDGGENWTSISKTGFHAVQFSPDGKYGCATGADGRIGIWSNHSGF